MSSVPSLDRPRRDPVTEYEKVDSGDNDFYIGPGLRRVRHIHSLSIYNIRLQGSGRQHHKNSSQYSFHLDSTETRPSTSYLDLENAQLGSIKDSLSPATTRDDTYKEQLQKHRKGQLQQPDNQFLLGLDDQIQEQLNIQDLKRDTFFDSFYSLNNFMKVDDPFYISRVFKNQLTIKEDLDFDSFNAKSSSLNLFVKRGSSWSLLCQYHIKLSLLVNVGDNLELVEKHFKNRANFLLIQLSDGCYYILPDSGIPFHLIHQLQVEHKKNVLDRIENLYHSKQRTCSYNQIMKMNNLSVCIRDLMWIKRDLGSRINEALRQHENSYAGVEEKIELISSQLLSLKELLKDQEFHNSQLRRKIKSIHINGDAKKNTIELLSSRRYLLISPDFDSVKEQLIGYMDGLGQTNTSLNLEKSRVAKGLLAIFPIISSSAKTKSSKYDFELFGYRFPTTSSTTQWVKILNRLSRTQMARLNALLGYLVLIIIKLSDYLCVPLRYPVKFLSSNSYIHDPISRTKNKNRLYPLFITQNSTLILRFSYGLMLFTKDLDQLFEYENLYKVEEFNLLVNLKILLTCLTSYDCRSDTIQDFVTEGFTTRESINETLLSEDRTNHIRKHLLGQSSDCD
ncbi:hypothetical protein FOA43_000533 [Brettanomyces nanus]|uniref:Uncharacterized protein n=1 Tax=Eeniella nana TaxID=13502 RepID=A0A875RWI0_EENNA|nr:uncharacterized protein FOA43_000533 [Brettanomyces nanus]QPG73226.1 hypothetical protein FOA43_000533 [Brettanomyces nanus]